MFKDILFFILCLLHILIWVFVLIAFIDIRTAKFNLYILIPVIYILHILPFHLFTESKKLLYKNNWEERMENIENKLIIPKYFHIISDKLNKYCTFNPISPQGMLIFGLITSSYRLYFYNKSKDEIKNKKEIKYK